MGVRGLNRSIWGFLAHNGSAFSAACSQDMSTLRVACLWERTAGSLAPPSVYLWLCAQQGLEKWVLLVVPCVFIPCFPSLVRHCCDRHVSLLFSDLCGPLWHAVPTWLSLENGGASLNTWLLPPLCCTLLSSPSLLWFLPSAPVRQLSLWYECVCMRVRAFQQQKKCIHHTTV